MKKNLKQISVAAFLLFTVAALFYSGNFTVKAENHALPKFDGAMLYKKNCATCHGNDGQSKSFRGKLLKAPNLTDAQWQADVSDEHIFNAISKGRKNMPAFGKKLSEKEMDSLVDFVRSLKK